VFGEEATEDVDADVAVGETLERIAAPLS